MLRDAAVNQGFAASPDSAEIVRLAIFRILA